MSVSRTPCKMWEAGVGGTIFKTERVRHHLFIQPQLCQRSLTGNPNVNKVHKKNKIYRTTKTPKRGRTGSEKDKQHQVYLE